MNATSRTGAATARGVGLFDALIALIVLSLGMLTMTRFQGRMVAQTTETQSRQVAAQFAAEHLSTVLVDVNNAPCYTWPQAGDCTSGMARAGTADWATRAAAALPGPVTTTSTLEAATGRLTVAITWLGKDSGETRTLQAVTDVRP
jgi:type IV pilus assembly protein PilV